MHKYIIELDTTGAFTKATVENKIKLTEAEPKFSCIDFSIIKKNERPTRSRFDGLRVPLQSAL